MSARCRTACVSLIAGVALLTGSVAGAQPQGRVATTAAALRASPVFFHGRQVAVLGTLVEARDLVRLEEGATAAPPSGAATDATPETAQRAIYVFWRERPTRTTGELRGEFWDLGRLTEGDTRFSNYNFRPLLDAVTQGRWPGRDQLFVLLGATMMEATVPETATLRAIALAPDRYENRSVHVSGRFRGRNLYGDLASPVPTPTKWDFVIQSADAAVWISGLRPKGRDFELDPSARIDTARWVQVSGTVRREGSRTWIEAREIALSTPPDETAVEVPIPATPKEPPPTVVFSAPVPDEPEVGVGVVVRVQFSRDMDGRSFRDHVRVTYAPPAGGGAALPPPIYTVNYTVGSRGIELKFAKPLEPFQTVKLELLEGIKTIDGDPLAPWTLAFSTGR